MVRLERSHKKYMYFKEVIKMRIMRKGICVLAVLLTFTVLAASAFAAMPTFDSVPDGVLTAENLAQICNEILGAEEEELPNASQQLSGADGLTYIAEAFHVEPAEETDSDEPIDYVEAMKDAGYIDDSFDTSAAFTKDDALNIIGTMIEDVTDESASGVETDKSYVIRSEDVELVDAKIGGDLIIGQGVGDGEVTLDNVSVEGNLIVLGGGSNSVVVRGTSAVGKIIVSKTEGDPVRVKVEGEAVVGTVAVDDNSKVIVNGAITTLVAGEEVSVELQSARIVNVEINGENAAVNVDAGSTVSSATINASGVQLTGTGTVSKAEVTENAKGGVVVDTNGTQVAVAPEAGDVTDSSGAVVAPSGGTGTTQGTPTGTGNGTVTGGSGGNR